MPRCREIASVILEFTDEEFVILHAMLGEAIENIERYLVELRSTAISRKELLEIHSNYVVLYRRVEKQHPLWEELPGPGDVNLSSYPARKRGATTK
jgi:hypothetical protein